MQETKHLTPLEFALQYFNCTSEELALYPAPAMINAMIAYHDYALDRAAEVATVIDDEGAVDKIFLVELYGGANASYQVNKQSILNLKHNK